MITIKREVTLINLPFAGFLGIFSGFMGFIGKRQNKSGHGQSAE